MLLAFLVRRLLWIVPVILTVTTITFFLMHRAPGGPWDREKPVAKETLQALNAKFGLDKPEWLNIEGLHRAWSSGERNPARLALTLLDSQYFNYLWHLVQGDLGPSYRSKGTETVQSILLRRFPTTAKVGIVAIAFAVVLGVPLGIIGALRQNSWADYLSLAVATVGVSMPSFIIAVLVVVFLSQLFGVKPIRRPEEWQGLSAAYLAPGIVLGLGTMSYITRLTRSSMLEVMRQDYIRTARAKGLTEFLVIRRHMLRNALISVITILGPAVAALVTGSFIIETIFNVPGMGREYVQAIASRDYSMIMGTTLMYALFVALANLWVDIMYGLLDPRIRV
ncbi:MAG: ABC transporter permease [Chloroflexota bacterium]